MANTTSGTVTFDKTFAIDEIIAEAYERIGSQVTSGYKLKSGNRPSGPGGNYDGSYNEDYEHHSSAGSLDECNGGELNGKFVYFVTNSYPFVGRCLWGEISSGFGVDRHN